MATYDEASRTKDYFLKRLFTDHPEIVSIAPRMSLDNQGKATGEAYIAIGIKPILTARGDLTGHAQSGPLPTALPVIDHIGKETSDQIPVVIEEEGEIVPEVYTARRRPCPGGYSIGHPRVTAGTLGGVARVGSTWGYILSNNHILAATNTGRVGDPVYQPGVYDGGNSSDTVGQLTRWVPISFTGNNEVDAAMALATNPWDSYVSRRVEGIGEPQRVADATVNQQVRKAGRTTQYTTGRILSNNATIRVNYGSPGIATFVNQLQYTRMSAGGDSGSTIWDMSSLTVVGLNFAGSDSASYGNKILRVLTLLSQAATVFDSDGNAVQFPELTDGISLLEAYSPRTGN